MLLLLTFSVFRTAKRHLCGVLVSVCASVRLCFRCHCIYLANAVVLVVHYFVVVVVCGRGQCLCVSATAIKAFNNIKNEVENLGTLEVPRCHWRIDNVM